MRHLPSATLLSLLLGAGCATAADLDQRTVMALKSSVPGATVGVDARFGTARAIANRAGLLTGAGGTGGAVRAESLALIAAADPHRAVKAFIAQYPQLFGDAALLDHGVVVDRDYADPSGTTRNVIWRQEIDGVPVQDARFVAHLANDGALVDISNAMVPGVLDQIARARVAGLATPAIDAQQAVAVAVGAPAIAIDAPASDDARRTQRFSAPGTDGVPRAQLVWTSSGGQLRLAWEVTAKESATQETWLVTVDANDALVLGKRSLTRWFRPKAQSLKAGIPPAAAPIAAAVAPIVAAPAPVAAETLGPITHVSTQAVRLNVYAPNPATPTVAGESPTPRLPGWDGPVAGSATDSPPAGPSFALPNYPTGLQTDSPPGGFVNRVWITGSTDPDIAPFGWINDGGTTTVGNNVAAHLDFNNSDPTDTGGPIATGAPSRDFNEGIAITSGASEPSAYSNASVVNAFFWANFMHDRLYALGFTEPDGNFQNDNNGKGGVAGDRVQADAQDGYGIASNLFRNNANFATTVDGTEGRMQMYVWDAMTPNRDGDLDGSVVCHEYTHGLSTRLVGGGDQLRALQSGGMGEGWSDFFSLSLLAPANADVNANYPVAAYVTLFFFVAGVPDPNYQNYFQGIRRYPYTTSLGNNPLTFANIDAITPNNNNNSEVHSQGEIWCNALWQARANWLTRYGTMLPAYQTANDDFLKLIVHALKLTPANPTFLEARDAILRADVLDHGGANQDILWAAFAKRGMGPAAESSGSGDTSVIEDTNLNTVDVIGGTFHCGGTYGAVSGQSMDYTLHNFTGATQTWAATKATSAAWLDISPASGSIAAGAEATVTLSLNAVADTLLLGPFDETVIFTASSGLSTNRKVMLDISGSYVSGPATYQWLTTPSPVTLSLPNDGFVTQALPFAFKFYEVSYGQISIGSNGLAAFTFPTLKDTAHSAFPQALGDPFPVNGMICPLWYNLNPESTGTITTGVTGSFPYRVYVVTWNAVPYFDDNYYPNSNRPPLTFQMQLQETTNIIKFAYKEMQAAEPYGDGRYASVGVEHPRGFIHTEWAAPGAVSLPNGTAIQFTYVDPGVGSAVSIGNATDGGSGQCGVGFGLPAAIVGTMFLIVRRVRSAKSAA